MSRSLNERESLPCDDLAVTEEPAAAQITRMSTQFFRAFGSTRGTLLVPQIIHRANIVQPTASNEITGRGIRACHHPAGAKRDSVNFVGRGRVPDNELAVLGGRD